MENRLKLLLRKLYIIIIICIWSLMIYILGWVCGWIIGKKNHNNINKPFPITNIIDSMKPKLDSIEYNIILKDSIIYNIKEEMKNEVNQSQQLTDTAAVNKFYKLVSE